MRVRKKPIEVDAHLWDGDWAELSAWADSVSDGNGTGLQYDPNTGILIVKTLEGDMKATRGDFVICGVEGEFYFVAGHIFPQTYDII